MPYQPFFSSERISPEEQAKILELLSELQQDVAAIIREEADHKAAAENKNRGTKCSEKGANYSAGGLTDPELIDGQSSVVVEHAATIHFESSGE